ncbi:MAG: hypothetical protein D6B25_16605 [Desulfobulbaceae bacterium]|nr:MAG: hypothetical protein D6B25_16605 [Desulfobulbaceae bacterium]
MKFRPHKSIIFSVIFITLITVSSLQGDEQPPPVPSKTENFSSVEERRLFTRIREERETIFEEKKALELRKKELKTLEDAVDKKLAEIDNKLLNLEKQKKEIAALLQEKDTKEAAKLQNLGKIYEKMDPAKAALALSGLDQKLAADLLAVMKPKSAAKILDNLQKPKATDISKTFSQIQLE